MKMKGNTFQVTVGLIEEVLPGLDVYFRITLAKEKLTHVAETRRAYFIDRINILTDKPFEVTIPEQEERCDSPPPKLPPRRRQPQPPPVPPIEFSDEKHAVVSDVSAITSTLPNHDTANENDGEKAAVFEITYARANGPKPPVPPKPLYLFDMMKPYMKSGYSNEELEWRTIEEDGNSIKSNLIFGERDTAKEKKTKISKVEDEYEPIGPPSGDTHVLDSNANIENCSHKVKSNVDEGGVSQDIGNLNEDHVKQMALGFHMDVPKMDALSNVDTTKNSEKDIQLGDSTPPPLPPGRPRGSSKRKVSQPAVNSSSLTNQKLDEGMLSHMGYLADMNRTIEDDVTPPPLPPRKKIIPHPSPCHQSQEAVDDIPPTLPPRPPALGHKLFVRDGESPDKFAASQRVISNKQATHKSDDEGDYDTIDKEDNTEGHNCKTNKEVEVAGKGSEDTDDDSTCTSYESYEDEHDHTSSQENVLVDPVLPSKESLSNYSMTFPRFRSFRKSKRKGKMSTKSPSGVQDNAIVFSGELSYKGRLTWTKRFCIITRDQFLCYKSDRESRPVLSFALKQFDAAYVEKEGKKHHVIRISHPGFDTHLFSVNTKERAEMWIEQLNSAGSSNAALSGMTKASTSSLNMISGDDTPSTEKKFSSQNSLSNMSMGSSHSESDMHSHGIVVPQQYVLTPTPNSKEQSSPSPRNKSSTKRPLSTPTSQDIINRAIVLQNTPSSQGSPSPRRNSIGTSHKNPRRTSQIFGTWGRKKGKKTVPAGEPSAPMNFEVYEGSAYDVTVSGYVQVKSQFSATQDWARKYCRIKNGFIECYKDITDYRHEFNFPLVGCEVVTANEPNHELAFKIVQGDTEKMIIEPSNMLEQGRWLAVLIKEIRRTQPPPASSDDENDIVLTDPLEINQGVFHDDGQFLSDNASFSSDGYEKQAIRKNLDLEDAYDELKSMASEEDGYIESYGPEVVSATQALDAATGSQVKSTSKLDDGYASIKADIDRRQSDSELVVHSKASIIDAYAKVDKRSSVFMTLEETSSKRSSIISEYSDIMSAVMNVGKQFAQTFGRSISFDSGTSLVAAVESHKDYDAIAAKEYEGFEKLHQSRASSAERESVENSVLATNENSITKSITTAVIESVKPVESVVDDGANIESGRLDLSEAQKSKLMKAKKRQSDLLYRELADSLGSLEEIYTPEDSCSEDEHVLLNPSVDNVREEASTTKGAFNDLSDRKKDSGICGDSSESLSILIKAETDDTHVDERDSDPSHAETSRNSAVSLDKELVGSFVNTSTSVYAKEVPVSLADSDGCVSIDSTGVTRITSAYKSDRVCSVHDYDDIEDDEKIDADGSASEKAESQDKLVNETLETHDSSTGPGACEIEEGTVEWMSEKKDEETGLPVPSDNKSREEKQVDECLQDISDDKVGDESGASGGHVISDISNKMEKCEGDVERQVSDSEHEYDPIEFVGDTSSHGKGESSESEYEPYSDNEEETLEEKQRRASAIHAEVRVKKKEWAHLKRLRLAVENQKIQSRNGEERKRFMDEMCYVDIKIKAMEELIAGMVDEHRALAASIANLFSQRGLGTRKLSMISVESFMIK